MPWWCATAARRAAISMLLSLEFGQPLAEHAAIQGQQEAMDGFVRMNAGTLSPAEFLSPENVRSIMAGGRPPS